MNVTRCAGSRTALSLLAALVLALFLPAAAAAQDTDRDYLTDADELAYPPNSFICAATNCASSGCTWYTYGGHNYLICSTTKTWADAREFCRSYGGDLVAINDVGESATLSGMMSGFWLGFNDIAAEGTWVWSHGSPSPASFTSWWPIGEPGPEDCAVTSSIFWYDNPCGSTEPFICEDHFASNPYDEDSDGDGLIDGWEYSLGAHPNIRDTDGDGLSDNFEFLFFSSPILVDTDADGLNDYYEMTTNCNPRVYDTDRDGVSDGFEYYVLWSDPLVPDTDGDWITDGMEYNFIGSNPLTTDSDGDGLSDSYEALLYLTDPTSNDTDGDGLPDACEINNTCLDPLIADSAADPDGDGQSNQAEYLAVPQTNPCAITDSDADGMSDWWEGQYTACGLNPAVGDSLADPDGDGRPNLVEYTDRTDPCVSQLAAAASRLVNYQGRLMTTGLPVNGSATLAFSLYGVATGGTPLWTETHTVSVANGLYSLTLGGSTVIPAGALTLPAAYLGIRVGGEELVPRQKITSAFNAANSDLIRGQRLETGTSSLSVANASSKTVRVYFQQPFTAPPRVTVGDLDGLIGGVPFISVRLYNVTATGFDVEFRSLTGATATGSAGFGYQAFGE